MIDNSLPFKYEISQTNSLTILKIEIKDEGYYACGYSSPPSTLFAPYSQFELFVKGINLIFKI